MRSDPLLVMGGEVGDMEGHALLGGGGSGGAGGGGESCPSSSDELSCVKSITSTFLPLLLSLPPWLDDEELRWSGPADVRHEPVEPQQWIGYWFSWDCNREKALWMLWARETAHISSVRDTVTMETAASLWLMLYQMKINNRSKKKEGRGCMFSLFLRWDNTCK